VDVILKTERMHPSPQAVLLVRDYGSGVPEE